MNRGLFLFDPRVPTEVPLILNDLTPEERARIAKKFPRIMPKAWIGISITAVAWAFNLAITKWHFNFKDFIAILIIWLGLSVAADRWESRSVMKKLRRELAELGRCAGCGYILRETSGTCPECGAPV